MTALREGDRIHNYLLEARIGSGSFGEVWRARHHIFGERVAIKIPTDAPYVRNLQREGITIHGLRHPNIVRAIDLDPYATPPYLIMELVEGPSLKEVIERFGATLPIPAAVQVLRGTLQALGAAHEGGVIHADLKPANILLARSLDDAANLGEQDIKVTDFGLGRIGGATAQVMLQSGSMTTEDGRSISGTLAYMSPEQRDGGKIDARSDLYSCGIILYELLTGERPQGTDLPSALRPGAPKHLDEVVQRSYTRLDRRFASAAEMLAALRPVGPTGVRTASTGTAGATPCCPACGDSVQREDQFCIHCGTQLVESVARCGGCGAFVGPQDRFCILCGKDLGVLT